MSQKDTNQWYGFLIILCLTLIIGTGLYATYLFQKAQARIEKIEQKP